MNTEWTDSVDRNAPFPEYPRPQLVRREWVNLNGQWDFTVTDSGRHPKTYDGVITVPFSPETSLSGTHHVTKTGESLWYRRKITLPETFSGKRVILHFDAADQEATVWVNASQVAHHVGGYLPFEADVTDAVENGEMTVTVRVTDETDRGQRTRGKQSSHPGGIWQSVWMEAVPESYISALRITPDYDSACVEISADVIGGETARAVFNGNEYTLPASIPVPGFEAWSPEHPKLYNFEVKCGEDSVQSYFAMRKFSAERDENGTPRLFLNGKPYFHNGLLDQGYWPDGLYTAPTDEAMINDIRTAKAMGFNMIRKHIKVEPLRWYYHCDRLGMLVWQDMPSGGGKYLAPVITAPLFTNIHIPDNAYFLFARGDASERGAFTKELGEMIGHLYNCPCIAMWVPFNEGWGQFDSAKACDLIRSMDKTRTIDHASGWHDQGISDVKSWHVYFRKYRFRRDKKDRAVVLSEFGGYSHFVFGHTYANKLFGYKKFETPAQLEIGLEELYANICDAKMKGLSAAVYTQLTDVENELNGLITYDRRAVKLAPEIMRSIVGRMND